MDTAIVLFGAGDIGARALAYYGRERVSCFVDNDEARVGTTFLGKPVISFKALCGIQSAHRVVISVTRLYLDAIKRQLEGADITQYDCFQTTLDALPLPARPQLEGFHNQYSGRRLFLIGNGPSLRIEDLERLKGENELCFASNKIFKAFMQTAWRPHFYCATDFKVISYYRDDIERLAIPHIFLSDVPDLDIHSGAPAKPFANENIYRFSLYYPPAGAARPPFSDDAARMVCEGFTVTYAMLQWAAYMGFSQVILLGVDASKPPADTAGQPHFLPAYHNTGEVTGRPKTEAALLAYQAAEHYSRSHGFRIYNATRGGQLDVFERVDFEELF